MAGTRRVLTASDRAEISTGLKAGWSITRIAGHIGRDKSVVSREVRRNSTRTRGYRMVRADCQATRRVTVGWFRIPVPRVHCKPGPLCCEQEKSILAPEC